MAGDKIQGIVELKKVSLEWTQDVMNERIYGQKCETI